MLLFLLIISIVFLAYVNGANDNFKGVATLFGSNTCDFKVALRWATICTFCGSITAVFLAAELVKNFSGKSLVPDELIQTPIFAISIAFGAAIAVFIATKIGMPISTTHALVGSLLGSGLVAVGNDFNFSRLSAVFLMPLLLSPLMALLLSLLVYHIFKKIRLQLGITKKTCVCLGSVSNVEQKLSNEGCNSISFVQLTPSLKLAKENECIEWYEGAFLGINAQKLLDGFHYLSAGIVSFARGLNDTPKIAGLLLVMSAFDLRIGLIGLGIAMAVGGLLNSKKVAQTMSKNIVTMNHGQGFTANMITGILVTTASIHGLPVSTTHVSVGSIFGIGTATGKADLKTIRNIMFSWVLTLPLAFVFGGIFYAFLKAIS